MTPLFRRLPSIGALVTFEAAGRHLSFTRAAAERHVSQAAISQQIRGLEESMGRALFERRHRTIGLTAAGRRLHQAVTMALDHIANTADELRVEPENSSLTIGVTTAVASFWLLPRLPGFRRNHPEVEVHILATDSELESVVEQIDVGIRFGRGHWPGFDAELLGRSEVFPVCSPEYLGKREPVAEPRELLNETLIAFSDGRWDWVDWPIWFKAVGVSDPPRRRALQVNSYPLLVQAARAGAGVALGWRHLIDSYLESGELVRLMDISVHTVEGFYLVTPGTRPVSTTAEAFCKWLVGTFEPLGATPAAIPVDSQLPS